MVYALMLLMCLTGSFAFAQDISAPPQNIEFKAFETTSLVISGNKDQHRFIIEVAATDQQKANGLMGRTELGANQGMIFLFDPPQEVSMWMKNTLIPLDMIFVNDKARIFRLRQGKPNDLTSLTSNGKAAAVIELPGGTVKKLNIRIGDRIITPVLAHLKTKDHANAENQGAQNQHAQ